MKKNKSRTMHWSTVTSAIVACSISSTIRTVNSFQLPQQSSIKSRRCVQSISIPTKTTTQMYETTVDPIIESAASQWMEKEKRLEDEMDNNSNDVEELTKDEQPTTSSTIDKTIDSNTDNYTEGRWELLHGNYILRPPSNKGKPRALIHFLGGALLGAAPQLTYRYLLERLSSKGYLVVATPYQLSFDHLVSCDEIIDKFERVAPDLARGAYDMLYSFDFMYILFVCILCFVSNCSYLTPLHSHNNTCKQLHTHRIRSSSSSRSRTFLWLTTTHVNNITLSGYTPCCQCINLL